MRRRGTKSRTLAIALAASAALAAPATAQVRLERTFPGDLAVTMNIGPLVLTNFGPPSGV